MRKLLSIALATIAFASGPVAAQTTGNGPYYAVPSWDQTLPVAQRFIVLSNFDNAAVLDRETGLVWERTPQSQSSTGVTAPFSNAVQNCYNANTGGRTGWRLPTPEELMSLVDRTQRNPALPAGHPFQQVLFMDNQGLADYWTASTLFPPQASSPGGPFLPGAAVAVGFNSGFIVAGVPTDVVRGVWCVRGGSHVLTNFTD